MEDKVLVITRASLKGQLEQSKQLGNRPEYIIFDMHIPVSPPLPKGEFYLVVKDPIAERIEKRWNKR